MYPEAHMLQMTRTRLYANYSNGDLLYCAAKNNMMTVITFLAKEKGAAEWQNMMEGACSGGHLNLVELAIKNGRGLNWNWGMIEACKGGHRHIVQLMIDKGAYCLTFGLCSAYDAGHMEIAEMLACKYYVRFGDKPFIRRELMNRVKVKYLYLLQAKLPLDLARVALTYMFM